MATLRTTHRVAGVLDMVAVVIGVQARMMTASSAEGRATGLVIVLLVAVVAVAGAWVGEAGSLHLRGLVVVVVVVEIATWKIVMIVDDMEVGIVLRANMLVVTAISMTGMHQVEGGIGMEVLTGTLITGMGRTEAMTGREAQGEVVTDMVVEDRLHAMREEAIGIGLALMIATKCVEGQW